MKGQSAVGQERIDSVRRFYDAEACTYDDSRWANQVGGRYDRIQQKLIDELLDDPSGKLVLEIGVGTGRIGRGLVERGGRLVGVDLSRVMLVEADRKLRGSGAGSCDLAVADGGRLPLADASVDLCLCINVVAHAPNYQAILGEVGRVLRPGGVFICNYINARSVLFPLALVVNRRNRGLRREVFTQWLAPHSVKSACADAGLMVRARRGQTHVPATAPRLVSLVQSIVDPAFRRSPLSAIAQHHIIAARRAGRPVEQLSESP